MQVSSALRPARGFSPGSRPALSFKDAATAVGVKVPTANAWLARGRKEDDGPYAEFADLVEKARAAAKAPIEPGDEAELRRRVWAMVEAGSREAAKLYWRMLHDGEAPPDPWSEFAVKRQ